MWQGHAGSSKEVAVKAASLGILMLVLGCAASDEPEYTCMKSVDQARCGAKQTAWQCTPGVVPEDCAKANMGYSEGYDWIVCCPEGMYP